MKIQTAPAPRPFLAELRGWLARAAGRHRAAHAYAPALHLEVAADIATDLNRQLCAHGRAAHAAEVEDLEALRLLRAAAADGFSAADLPAVEQAIRHIQRSAARDHALAEALPQS